ncbi:hypothetical protein DID73_02540 [Candidatus Marinamargulisbacteria bacterium SCGC AG-343-K17]|nr:hypothetical protein DID73_02540 [Candidatus Marinamargulisbacteria bacterium SCGC AG-343-K17]
MGHDSGAHLMYIPLSILPFIIFNHGEQKWLKWVSYICIYVSLSIVTIIQHTMPELAISLPPQSMKIIYYIAFSTTFCLVIPQIVVFYQAELNAKDLLKSANDQLSSTLVKLKESRDAQVMLTQHSDYAKLVQSIAHEFKNPLQMLQGTAEIGLLKDESNKELFGTIISSVERLNNVIQPLLLYLNKKTQYSFEAINLEKVVEEIMVLSKANCKAKSIQLSFDNQAENSEIMGDAQFIGQVIINLITNAIQAIPNQGGAITIQLLEDPMMLNNDTIPAVKMNITDNGCGIPEGKINSIFMPYESDHSSENNLGLGLSIVAKIVKDHQGLIKVSSSEGAGTTISVWFQMAKKEDIQENTESEDIFQLDDSFFEA